MQVMAEVLENEFRNAFEVKDPDSLHRGISILVESIPQKEQNKTEHDHFRESMLKMDSKMEATIIKMDEGFKRMDERFKASDQRFDDVNKRFDDVNKRFDDVNKRFDDMSRRSDMQIRFITVGFIMLTVLMSVYQFLA
ncbi:MAG TPA: hypothetical protein DCO79_08860 [Spirochaeta sp.]|nr:hypothetical protein [Spirochaeta sp.]